MESDLRNIQIDRPRSASTEGTEVKDRLDLTFHSMSLPGANLVWHCPYVLLFSSSDGKADGKDYREFGLIKLNGENEGDTGFAKNSISVKKTEEFPGWDAWKAHNKKGMEFEVTVTRKGNRIVTKCTVLGIETENTTTLHTETDRVFAALTGDQVALTDIRLKTGRTRNFSSA
jgi:hypothetical protein